MASAYVYAAISDGGLIKIGFTRKYVEERIKELKAECGEKVKLIVAEGYARGIDGLERERELHKIFSRFRVYGEWFAITPWQLGKQFPKTEKFLWRVMLKLKVPSAVSLSDSAALLARQAT